MKITKNIFLLLILIFSASETKPADWQLLKFGTDGQFDSIHKSGGYYQVEVFIDKESLNANQCGGTTCFEATYIFNLLRDLHFYGDTEKTKAIAEEKYKKFPKNTKSIKLNFATNCLIPEPVTHESEVVAFSEKMAKGKATIVHTEKINIILNDEDEKGYPNNPNPFVYLNYMDAMSLKIATCEQFKLPVFLNSENTTNINSDNTTNRENEIEQGNLFIMIIHFTLVIILFIILKILGILKAFGVLSVEAPISFGFFLAMAWIVSLSYLEDLDTFARHVAVDEMYDNAYFLLGWLPFLGWARFVGHQVLAQKREEYLRSPEGQLELAKYKRDELYKILTDISGISDKVARTILDQYPSFDKLNRASIEKISEIPSIGKNLATAIKARLNNLSN